MRKIVVFTMILTVIFAIAGCTANREPDKKATESSSANAVIDALSGTFGIYRDERTDTISCE